MTQTNSGCCHGFLRSSCTRFTICATGNPRTLSNPRRKHWEDCLCRTSQPELLPSSSPTSRGLREALGESVLARVWAEGRAMTLEYAVQFALRHDGSDI